MKIPRSHILTFIFSLFFAALVMTPGAFAQDNAPSSRNASSADNTSTKDKTSSSSTQKTSTKSSTQKSSTKSSAKKSSSSSAKKSSSKKKSRTEVYNRKAERASKAAKPIFSEEEIARYRAMPFETWESPRDVSDAGVAIAQGFAQPYPYGNLMRQFRKGSSSCKHGGHDIGIVDQGQNGGMGTVINAVVKSEITLIGRTGQNESEFGKQDKRTGTGHRASHDYPRQILVPGYGLVYPFSLNYGRWHSGMVLETKVLEGPLEGYTIRYMHMADIRPDLKVGDILEPGEHIAIMGSTAIMDSSPHVHIDASTPSGKRIDLAKYIGIPPVGRSCSSSSKLSSVSKKSSGSSKSSSQSTTKSAKKSTVKSSSKSSKAATKAPKKRENYTRSSTVTDSAEKRTLDRS